MKPIYKSLTLATMTLQVSLALNAQVYDGETTSETALLAEVLDSLRVELIAPNVSGARDLINSGECTIDGSDLSVALNAANWIKGGTYRVQVSATFGTQTQVIYALDVTVPYYASLSSSPQEYEDTVTVVSTVGDGDKSGADATVYAKDGDGNAHITKPLSIGDGVASGEGAVASGYTYGVNSQINASIAGAVASGCTYGVNSHIEANGAGAVASGCTDGVNSHIEASSSGAVASGNTSGESSQINASGDGAVASGYTSGESSQINASGDGAVASGYTSGDGSQINASSAGAVASGYTSGENSQINASSDGAVASGYTNGDGSQINAGSAGAVASGYTNGENSQINASSDGAVASGYTSGDGSQINASSAGAVASGYTDSTSGDVIASGAGSQAFGIGVQATQDGQMAVGKCNVIDEDDTFQFIVGNGADDEHRSNAFGVTKSGELALFKADGTPIYLDASKLEALIAMLPTV